MSFVFLGPPHLANLYKDAELCTALDNYNTIQQLFSTSKAGRTSYILLQHKHLAFYLYYHVHNRRQRLVLWQATQVSCIFNKLTNIHQEIAAMALGTPES